MAHIAEQRTCAFALSKQACLVVRRGCVCFVTALTLGRHPPELLQPQLLANRLMPTSTLRTYGDGRLAHGSGLVTVRQRPGTAKGVLFVTL